MITRSRAQRWLALYFLIYTAFLGGYVLIFGETWLLPISRSDAQDSFQIIIPVFLGQLTVVFQWVAANMEHPSDDQELALPDWAVKGPPLIAIGLFVAATIDIVVGNMGQGHQWAISGEGFKNIITFSVSILNASTVFLVARLFPHARRS